MVELVAKQTPEDEVIFANAKEAGCSPIWRNGMLGWAWHCGCEDLKHAADQQCSVIAPATTLCACGSRDSYVVHVLTAILFGRIIKWRCRKCGDTWWTR
jgi:hypothetical protein